MCKHCYVSSSPYDKSSELAFSQVKYLLKSWLMQDYLLYILLAEKLLEDMRNGLRENKKIFPGFKPRP